MKLSTLFAAVVGAVIAGSAVSVYHTFQTRTAAGQGPVALALDKPVAAEITGASQINYSDGVRSSVFDLPVEQDQTFILTVSGPLRAQISVLHNGTLVARNDMNANRGQADALQTVLGFKATAKGTYQVAVSGVDSRSFGPFELNARVVAPYDGAPLQPGGSIYDWATGTPLDYKLHLPEDGIYTLDMRADQNSLDAYLTLLDRNGLTLMSDDDGGEDLNARIQTLLKAGDYTLRASSADGGSGFQGGFTLSATAVPLPSGERLEPNAPLVLDAEPAVGVYTGQRISHPLEITEPTLVTIGLSGQGFEPALSLDPGGMRSQPRNAGAGQQGQQLRTVLQPGTYQVRVGDSGKSGIYTLVATGAPVPDNIGGGPLAVGETQHAQMLGGITEDTYTFTITTAGNYVIEMKAAELDSYLTLLRNGQAIDEDDDSGGDFDARIRAYLEPGEYQIRAASLYENASDSEYSISLKRD